jgi:CBS domain-containing protein
MLTDQYDALPVVDFRGDLVGVIAHRHLVAQLADDWRAR